MWSACAVGRVNFFFFRVEWVELVVKLTKLSHWGLVPGHLLQNWSCAFDLKFENLSGFFYPEPSQYSTWHVSFASYRHNKLAVDGSNAHTIHGEYTDGIASLIFTWKFFTRSGFFFIMLIVLIHCSKLWVQRGASVLKQITWDQAPAAHFGLY